MIFSDYTEESMDNFDAVLEELWSRENRGYCN